MLKGNNMFRVEERCVEVNYYFKNIQSFKIQFLNKTDDKERRTCNIELMKGSWIVRKVSLNGIDGD
jgi:hypothetical protein